MARDISAERSHALKEALDLYRGDAFNGALDREGSKVATTALLETATDIYRWLTGPVSFMIIIGPVLSQDDGQPTGRTIEGFPMQLHDSEKIDLNVTVADAKGVAIADDPSIDTDNLVWSFSDPNVATLTVSADTRTCTVIAGLPGSGTGTVTLGDLSATFAVDVVPGAAALVSIAEGTPVPQ